VRRYIRAFEVGQSPISVKYDLAVSLKTQKNGPVIRNQTKLPHAVDTTQRVAVICKPDSLAAKQAIANGASLVGEDVIFDAVKAGRIEFERCLCHVDSKDALAKSGVARVLGPRNLMPNEKRNTIVKDVKAAMTSTIGGTQYREKIGVIRVPIGQLRYTPEQLQANIKAFMTKIKADIAALSDRIGKDIHEVVSAARAYVELRCLILRRFLARPTHLVFH
jgi:large subunit ribosomal protein L1